MTDGDRTIRSDPHEILIAEDDRVARHILQSWLQRWGYRVVVAQDGLEAWNILQSGEAPRIAIIDWMMPGMDGVQICCKIRQGPKRPYRYILLLSARADKQDVVAGLEAGADDYLTKPVNADELHARVRTGRRILDLEESLIRANLQIAEQAAQERALELQLRQSQKLQAVGTLAAGIAHEINTPIQFIGDNLRFLQDSFTSLQGVVSEFRQSRDVAGANLGIGTRQGNLEGTKGAEIEYLNEEIPKALSQSIDGTRRVASIVLALKEFAHPGGHSSAPADLNRALKNALIVAGNELKDLVEVEEDLHPLPPVVCSVGDLSQAFLNLLVNAAHAIHEVVKDSGKKGKIRVESRSEGDWVSIAISDSGCGIPEKVRDKVFDPFFTTKEVGRGSGQGLAIARSAVVDKHGGTLTFTSVVGQGTTFVIRLPLKKCADP